MISSYRSFSSYRNVRHSAGSIRESFDLVTRRPCDVKLGLYVFLLCIALYLFMTDGVEERCR